MSAIQPKVGEPVSDELVLVQSAKGGDVSAFEELVKRYDRNVFRIAQHIIERCAYVTGFRAEHILETLPAEFTGRYAEQLLRGRARVTDHAVCVADGDHVARTPHEFGEPFVESAGRDFAMQGDDLASRECLTNHY